jgi:hypothetical protein
MYSGWILSDASKTQLTNIFGQAHPDLIAHHITYMFGRDAKMPPEAVIKLVGRCVDDKIECFVAEVNGSVVRDDGEIYHITWSIDRSKGAKPVDSNKAIANIGFEHLEHPISIKTTPDIVKF